MIYPSLPLDDFGISTTNYLQGSALGTVPIRTVDSPSPGWNISRYLPTTTRGLTKNSKNFQPLLRKVRHHILSDSSDIWRRNFNQEILYCLLEVLCPILNLIVLRPSDFALKTERKVPNWKTHSKLRFCGMLVLVYLLVALWICSITIHTQAIVTNGVLFLCCRKMLSISESINDMEAYTHLTDHVYHQILCSNAPELEEVICTCHYNHFEELSDSAFQRRISTTKTCRDVQSKVLSILWTAGAYAAG